MRLEFCNAILEDLYRRLTRNCGIREKEEGRKLTPRASDPSETDEHECDLWTDEAGGREGGTIAAQPAFGKV